MEAVLDMNLKEPFLESFLPFYRSVALGKILKLSDL